MLGLRQTRQLSRASELAQSLLEDCRARKLDDVIGWKGDWQVDGLSFDYQVEVDASPSGRPGVKRVAVLVTWKDATIPRKLLRETRISKWSRP